MTTQYNKDGFSRRKAREIIKKLHPELKENQIVHHQGKKHCFFPNTERFLRLPRNSFQGVKLD